MNVKIERIASTLEKEIGMILMTEIKNKDIRFVSITGINLSSDLSYAKVYITVLDESKKISTLKALKDAKNFIRRELTNRVDIRHIPQLEFVYDESIEYGKKIESLIDKVNLDK